MRVSVASSCRHSIHTTPHTSDVSFHSISVRIQLGHLTPLFVPSFKSGRGLIPLVRPPTCQPCWPTLVKFPFVGSALFSTGAVLHSALPNYALHGHVCIFLGIRPSTFKADAHQLQSAVRPIIESVKSTARVIHVRSTRLRYCPHSRYAPMSALHCPQFFATLRSLSQVRSFYNLE